MESYLIPALFLASEIAFRGAWNGVAILARGIEPVLVKDVLPGDANDQQARYIEAAVKGVLIGCIYLPNGNPQPGPKFDYKLAWFQRLIKHASAIKKAGVPAVLAGDLNVVPTEFDIYPKHSFADNALLQPESRKAYARLRRQGWTDAIRSLYPEEAKFSFWSYLRNRWPRDAGLRLDFLMLSPSLKGRLVDGDVDRWARGQPEASDHAPVWIELAIDTDSTTSTVVEAVYAGRNATLLTSTRMFSLCSRHGRLSRRQHHGLPEPSAGLCRAGH